jgi:hypothetical protein
MPNRSAGRAIASYSLSWAMPTAAICVAVVAIVLASWWLAPIVIAIVLGWWRLR